MIQLNDSLLIGKGRDRACYQHPEHPEQCIKVALRKEKQSKREQVYFNYLRKKNCNLNMFSQHLGTIQTNLGTGHLYELFREKNGQLSPTLKEAIETDLIDKEQTTKLIVHLEEHLIKYGVCAYDLSPSNLILVKDVQDNTYLKLIDGIGVANSLLVYFPIKAYTNKVLKTALKRLHGKVNKAFHYKNLGIKPPKKERKSRYRKVIERIILPTAILTLIATGFYLASN